MPIPPELVAIPRWRIAEFGVAEDGRLFRSERGRSRRPRTTGSTYYRVREDARRLALTPEQVASPLAARPYDLRHAAVSTWLNGGVAPTEVAERAGRSVETLLKRYAKCLDDERERDNRLIEAAPAEDGRRDGEAAQRHVPPAHGWATTGPQTAIDNEIGRDPVGPGSRPTFRRLRRSAPCSC